MNKFFNVEGAYGIINKCGGGNGMIPAKNSYVYIYSYKHDGSLHRTWTKGYVLEADEDCYIVVNNKTLVSESDGRKWYTREPAICFFFPKLWFNMICMIRKSGVYYYCNLASPALYDKEAIKYIDYDLDIKVFPDGSLIHLDEDEYQEHKEEMNYGEDIDAIIRYSYQELLDRIKNGISPFSQEEILQLYNEYLRRQHGKSRNYDGQ